MLNEPTTLASFANLIGETLQENYGVDPLPVYAEADIDTGEFSQPGARISFRRFDRLWALAVEASGDRWIGLEAGARAQPAHFYVLGHAWLASATLQDGLQRLVRYGNVLSPAIYNASVLEDGRTIAVIHDFPDPEVRRSRVADEFGFTAFFKMCDLVSRRPVRPLSVDLLFPCDDAASKYDELFGCPISYGNEREIFYYSTEVLAEPLPGYIPEVLDATTRITEDYIASLDQNAVATEVRRLLVKMLPSGQVDQASVASRLNRSRRTLQRQLMAEGTSYRDILDDTRRSLSEKYLREGGYSQAEIAFTTGFAEKRSFARAFKRWTGMSPGQYRKVA